MSRCFAIMNGMPEYSGRAKVTNVNVGDILHYKVKGRMIFSSVIGTTPKTIKVVDLFCEIGEGGVIQLYETNVKNSTTDCALKDTRKLNKVVNVEYM